MRNDKDLQNEILEELRWDPVLYNLHIKVDVEEGEITLTGAVDSYSKREAAEEVIKRVNGIKRVINKIEIRQPQIPHTAGFTYDSAENVIQHPNDDRLRVSGA